jgi:trigger factor
MQVSVENTGTLGRKITVTVPAERFEKEFVARLTKLSKNVKMAGFRPGKVPLKVVEKQYGPQLSAEVTGDLIQQTYIEAIGGQGLKPASGPKIEPKAVARGQALEYTAEFEVYPEIKRTDIKGKTIERPVAEIADEDIDRTIESLRRQRAEWQVVERAAADGDQVDVDFEGKMDGEAFPGGASKGYSLELGSSSFIPGFEDGLKGLSAGAEKTLKLKFPDQYHADHLAGKEVEFDVKVNAVREAVLPKVNEEFVKGLGVTAGTVDALRQEVRENLDRELKDRQRSLVRNQAMEALLDVNKDVESPEALIIEEARRMRSELAAMSGRRADDLAGEPTPEEHAEARRRVALGLAVAEVIRANELKADAESLKQRIEEMASGYEKPEEFVRMIYADKNRRSQLESMILEERAVEKLLESADVKDKSMSFKELVSMIRPGSA